MENNKSVSSLENKKCRYEIFSNGDWIEMSESQYLQAINNGKEGRTVGRIIDVSSPDKKVEASEWISVKDRLPEIGQRVLCCYYPRHPIMEGRTVSVLNRLVTNAATKSFVDENGFGNASLVTHWMPIPQLPKLTEHGKIRTKG